MLNFHKLAHFLNEQKKSCIVITEADLVILKQSLKAFGLQKKILQYPSIGHFAYDPTPPLTNNAAERIRTVQALKLDQPFCLLMSSLGWFEKRPILDDILQPLFIEQDSMMTHTHFMDILFLYGFERTNTVLYSGQFAVRGDRIDIFPPMTTYPVRVDFFGDTIEGIKTFDPITQKTISPTKKITIWPANEFLLGEKEISNYESNYKEQLSITNQAIVSSIIDGQNKKNLGHLWPLFYTASQHISEFYHGEPTIWIEPTINLEKEWEDIQKGYTQSLGQGRFILPVEELYCFV